MTTPKVIASSSYFADQNFATGNSALVSSVIVAVFNLGVWNATSTYRTAIMVGVLSFAVTFGMALLRNRQYAKNRTEFIQSIKDAVEKETGHAMTTKNVMAFLFSGEAADENGATLKVKTEKKGISILLTKK